VSGQAPAERPESARRAVASWSLAARLITRLGLGLSLLWLAATAFAALVTTHEINEVFDSALQEAAQRLRPLVVEYLSEHDEAGMPDAGDGDAASPHEEYLQYQVRDAAGAIVLRSHDAPLAPFAAPLRAGFADIDGQRFYTEETKGGRLFIQVGEARDHRTEAIWDSLVWLVLPLAALLPLAGIVIFRVVRRGTAPIDALRGEMESRDGGNLDAISEADLPRELMPVVHGLNHLLLRLRLALEHERSFAANSAHELRTPVAAALAQMQRLAAETDDAAKRERVNQAIMSLRRIGDLAEKLLQLSRADSGISLDSPPTDLLPVLDLVLGDYLAKPEAASRLRLDLGDVTELVAAIDIDAFAIVLRNLLDNAFLHGTPAAPVRISLGPDRCLHIANGGAVVPGQTLAELTTRFKRGPTSAAGSGLGLAIVETILRQAGYRLRLQSPASGMQEGFEAIVDFNRESGVSEDIS
jgi:two-component system OmpR family sensor kinase